MYVCMYAPKEDAQSGNNNSSISGSSIFTPAKVWLLLWSMCMYVCMYCYWKVVSNSMRYAMGLLEASDFIEKPLDNIEAAFLMNRLGWHTYNIYIHAYIHTYNSYFHSYHRTLIYPYIHTYIHTYNINTYLWSVLTFKYMHTYIHTYIHTFI